MSSLAATKEPAPGCRRMHECRTATGLGFATSIVSPCQSRIEVLACAPSDPRSTNDELFSKGYSLNSVGQGTLFQGLS